MNILLTISFWHLICAIKGNVHVFIDVWWKFLMQSLKYWNKTSCDPSKVGKTTQLDIELNKTVRECTTVTNMWKPSYETFHVSWYLEHSCTVVSLDLQILSTCLRLVVWFWTSFTSIFWVHLGYTGCSLSKRCREMAAFF